MTTTKITVRDLKKIVRETILEAKKSTTLADKFAATDGYVDPAELKSSLERVRDQFIKDVSDYLAMIDDQISDDGAKVVEIMDSMLDRLEGVSPESPEKSATSTASAANRLAAFRNSNR